MNPTELRIFTFFNNLAGKNPVFDAFAASFTKLSPMIFLILFCVCFFVPFKHQRDMRRSVLLAGLSGILAVVASYVIMLFVYRARPFVVLPPDQIRMIISHAADSSFPSNHTVGSAAMAAGMWRSPSKIARWITAATALLVGISRMVVGVHWPSDVLLSLLLGGLAAQAIVAMSPLLSPILNWVLDVTSNVEAYARKKTRGV